MDTHENAPRTPKRREQMVRAVVERGLSKAAAARRFNTTPKTVSKWVDRFRVEGVEGLRDRSSRPLSSPSQIPQATCAAVEAMRRQRYTGEQIAAALAISPATISRILRRLGLNRLSALEPAEPRKGVVKFPPSIAGLPSRPDPREPSPEQLEQIIRDLPLKKGGEDNSAADARELFEGYALASLAGVWQKKAGTAGSITVARDLKLIAGRSSTLLELLKRADRNTFEAWAAVPYPEAGSLESATQEWLQLKNLLEITAQRAAESARSVKDTLKSSAHPKRGKRGRPIDQLGDLVTIEAANIYERRTGKSPVRNIDRVDGKPFGDFHDFLTRVFEVLGIKSSPDARNAQMQAKLRAMKK